MHVYLYCLTFKIQFIVKELTFMAVYKEYALVGLLIFYISSKTQYVV